MQFNCNGIRNSREELLEFLTTHNIRVACIQETKLSPNSNPVLFQGYALVRRDRPSADGGGGLAFLVREDTPYLPLDTNPLFPADDVTEHQGIFVTIDHIQVAVINLYIPPATSCPRGFTLNLVPLFERDFGCDTLVVGDFNAFHYGNMLVCGRTSPSNLLSPGFHSSPSPSL